MKDDGLQTLNPQQPTPPEGMSAFDRAVATRQYLGRRTLQCLIVTCGLAMAGAAMYKVGVSKISTGLTAAGALGAACLTLGYRHQRNSQETYIEQRFLGE